MAMSLASPGAILAAVVLTDNREFSLVEQVVSTLLMLAVLWFWPGLATWLPGAIYD